jgi:hypothetical protein
MPELTRRRSLGAPDECWHVFYGDVRVGTIAIRTGMPPGEDPWSWACGFYPGSHPRECTDGIHHWLPKAEHQAAEWQAAMEALILVATSGGPTMFARIGIMRALNRGHVREFNPDRKDHHWGRRKLARDR